MSLVVIEKALEEYDNDSEKHIDKCFDVASSEWRKILEKIRKSLKPGEKQIFYLLTAETGEKYRHELTRRNVKIYDTNTNKKLETSSWSDYLECSSLFPVEARIVVGEIKRLKETNNQLYQLIK